MEKVIRDSVCSHAEDWMATVGSVGIKAKVERLTNVRPQQDTSITALKNEVEGTSPRFGTEFASLADSFTTLSKASEVHDKFHAVATARMKYLEEDLGVFVWSGDVWEDRVNRLEDQAGQVEAQVWQLVEQAGQLEELHRELIRLSVASDKCAASSLGHPPLPSVPRRRLPHSVHGMRDDASRCHRPAGVIQLVLFAMQMHDTSVSAIIYLPLTP